MNYNFIDLTGQKFGRLTVIKCVGKNKWRNYKWLCCCDCGNLLKVIGSDLRNGHTKSCGCLITEILIKRNTTHKMTKSVEHKSWENMKNRCLNPNVMSYKHYGGRGITICDEWLKFENFYKDMGDKPSKNHSIDRIDNNGNYCKENCRWTTAKEQCRNKRTNRMITYKRKTKCLAEWAEKLNINYNLLYKRLYRGWSIERAFNS